MKSILALFLLAPSAAFARGWHSYPHFRHSSDAIAFFALLWFVAALIGFWLAYTGYVEGRRTGDYSGVWAGLLFAACSIGGIVGLYMFGGVALLVSFGAAWVVCWAMGKIEEKKQ